MTADRVVAALEGTYGVHPGERRNHTKGTCALGEFVGWPKNRRELNVGTLTISSAMTQEGAGCEKINYDPLVMGDGIAPSNDPVLLFRSPSYALSFTKRLQGL